MCSFSSFGSLKLTILFTFKLPYFQVWLHEHLLEELEELEDIRAYDKAKAKKETPISLRDAIQQRRKKQKN